MPTQTPIETKRPLDPSASATPPKIQRVEVYWTTVTYKTVAIYLVLIAAIIFSAMYIALPNWYSATFRKISTAIDNAEDLLHPLHPPPPGTPQKLSVWRAQRNVDLDLQP